MEVVGKGPINLAMVQSGQAFVYRQYLGRCDWGVGVPGGGAPGPGPAAGCVGSAWAYYAAVGLPAWGSGSPQRRGGLNFWALKRARL